ncbi:MAG: PKD domain-containing protein [Pirellula sp.]|jgi:PKD repeat protein|nr:dockerin type I domain-containing protein [Pirellula sp.]
MRIKTKRLRKFTYESLEPRFVMTAEGSVFSLQQSYDTSGLGGNVSGVVEWGDGLTAPLAIGNQTGLGSLRFRFDYSLDSSGFFADSQRRQILQNVADSITSKLSDTLQAIVPSGASTWTATFPDPSTGAAASRLNLTVNANEILVFAGARSMGNTRGLASRGGFRNAGSTQEFIDIVRARGQTGALSNPATDFGPWGGSLSFDSVSNWHFGADTIGLDANEFDFATAAGHELIHLLGFGLSPSFDAKLVGGGFAGANAVAVAGVSPVPMADSDHFSASVLVNGQQAIMAPQIDNGLRRLPTRLDFAALQDVGWQFNSQTVQVSASHTFGDNANFNANVRLRGSLYGERVYPLSIGITNVAPTQSVTTNRSTAQGVPISISRIAQFTDPGFGAPNATPPLAESFSYSIAWGDGSPNDSGSATIESLGSAGNLTRGFFDGTHTYAAIGSYVVTVTVQDDDGGVTQQQFTIQVTPPPELRVSVDRQSVTEDAGQNAANFIVQRIGFDLGSSLSVNLTSSDTSELTLPANAVFPVGIDTIQVPIHAIDDSLLDGSIAVQLFASINAIQSLPIVMNVLDRESLLLSASRLVFGEHEGAGVSVLTVTRSNTDTDQPLTVQLISNDPSEATTLVSVTIPAGQQSTTTGVTAVDDNLFDGPQSVRITTSEARYSDAFVDLTVTDYQPIAIVPMKTRLSEEEPDNRSTQTRVEIRSPAPAGGIAIQLSTSVPRQLTLPASVVIPAGQTSAEFLVSLVDDFIPQGERSARIFASGDGLVAATVDLVLTDADPAYWTNLREPKDVNDDNLIDALDVLDVVNSLNRLGAIVLNPNRDLDLSFVDTNRDGIMDSLDVLLLVNFINSRG